MPSRREQEQQFIERCVEIIEKAFSETTWGVHSLSKAEISAGVKRCVVEIRRHQNFSNKHTERRLMNELTRTATRWLIDIREQNAHSRKREEIVGFSQEGFTDELAALMIEASPSTVKRLRGDTEECARLGRRAPWLNPDSDSFIDSAIEKGSSPAAAFQEFCANHDKGAMPTESAFLQMFHRRARKSAKRKNADLRSSPQNSKILKCGKR